MKKEIITKLEQERIVKTVKMGEISSLNSFLHSFNVNIASCYRLNRCNEDNLNFEDFQQECRMAVIKALKSFKQNSYGELRSFIKITIKNKSIDIAKKHKNQNNYNILGDDSEDIHDLSARNHKYSLENEVVNRLTVEHSNEKFIRRKLTDKQYDVLKAFYFGECPRKYELENGMKPRNFDKILDRALKKIAKIIKTKEFKDFHFLSIPPKCIIRE
jgi:DNA-directed RNA polymerase specialized sigma subunit, sigma24 homolog